MKREIRLIAAGILCFGLAACRSSQEAGAASHSANPYLHHYLPADTLPAGPSRQSASKVEQLNRKQLEEKVNPIKEASWSDLLRDILQHAYGQ